MLSGGGARGLTHVGVLKVLHEMRVPIDYIAATSMGAIVGGLYASGMTPDQMQRQLGAVSWPTLLSDSPERSDVGFRRKEELAAFPLAFEIGYRDGEFLWFKGALSGSNLELFLHELTRNVDSIQNFDKLPIPFRAVATNMITGKEVVFDSGRLYQAMRASMSVPGMFAPVEIDGRILGDGGLVNNLPVDLVRAMGADIVIAVNIGTPLMSRDQLQSVVGYASQMLNILTEQNVRAQLATLKPTDILISPDLGNLTFIDFAAAPKFVEIGEKAAEAVRTQLAALSDSPERYAAFERKLKVLPDKLPEKLDFVTVEGTRYANPEVLEEQMRTKPDEPFKLSTLESDLARLYGRGEFEQIDYQLATVGNQTGVVVTVVEKSWGPELPALRHLAVHRLPGRDFLQPDARAQPRVAQQPRRRVEQRGHPGQHAPLRDGALPAAFVGRNVFASGYGMVQRAPEFIFDGENRVAEYDVLTETAGADLGLTFGTSGEVRLGIKWLHQRGDPTIAGEILPDIPYPIIKTTRPARACCCAGTRSTIRTSRATACARTRKCSTARGRRRSSDRRSTATTAPAPGVWSMQRGRSTGPTSSTSRRARAPSRMRAPTTSSPTSTWAASCSCPACARTSSRATTWASHVPSATTRSPRCRSSAARSTSADRWRRATCGPNAAESRPATCTARAACSSPPTRGSGRSTSRTASPPTASAASTSTLADSSTPHERGGSREAARRCGIRARR